MLPTQAHHVYTLTQTDMIKNYLKVAFRSILRNKLTAFINIAGLALAMACCLLIALFVRDEWSYDRHHSKADRIYRVTRNFLSPDGTVSLHLGHVAPPFGPLLKNDFAEIEQVARVRPTQLLVTHEEGGQERAFNETGAYFVEPEIFKIFDIPVQEGNAERALNDPFHVMLSEKTARKYFGDSPAIGQSLQVANRFNVVVSGIFPDFPAQSHWHPDILVSFSTLNDSTIYGRRRLETNWGNNAFATYILVEEPFDAARMESRFPAFLDKHMGPDMGGKVSTWTNLFLQKLTDIHLRSHLDSELEANGNINTVYMMGVIGIFIILIACFNFVNLSTARATRRAKEAGLRKVAGAFKTQLIAQHLWESIIIALLALLVCMVLSFPALRWLNDFTGKNLTLDIANDAKVLVALVLFAVFTGILAGIYPAFVISSFSPATILKGSTSLGGGKAGLRKVLVVTQFAISITLIIATLITFRQLRYMNNLSLGYARDQIVLLPYTTEVDESYDAFYQELLKNGNIRNAGRSNLVPTGRLLDYRGSARVPFGDSLVTSDVVIKNVAVDHEFFDAYAIDLVAGRNFSRDIKTDDSLAFILNETAVKMIGLTPEEMLTRDFIYGDVRGRVVGVVRDFHFESLHEPIVPVVFHVGRYNNISVQVTGTEVQDALAHMERIWKQFVPGRPFEYDFLSMRYQQLYDAEKKQGQLFVLFSGLAIFIASLGLFGLATFNTVQRIKEIGIRKVLGASVGNIVQLLSKEILILVLWANLIAWPVAWYFADEWLGNFAYRIENDMLVYILASVAAVVVALITVSGQTIRAAMSNPAQTLRSE